MVGCIVDIVVDLEVVLMGIFSVFYFDVFYVVSYGLFDVVGDEQFVYLSCEIEVGLFGLEFWSLSVFGQILEMFSVLLFLVGFFEGIFSQFFDFDGSVLLVFSFIGDDFLELDCLLECILVMSIESEELLVLVSDI